MHCEDLLVNYGSNWQAVETVGEGLPQFNVVSAFTCTNARCQLNWKDYWPT